MAAMRKLLVWVLVIAAIVQCGAYAQQDDTTQTLESFLQVVQETKYKQANEIYQNEIVGNLLLEMQAAEAVADYFGMLVNNCTGDKSEALVIEATYLTIKQISWTIEPSGIEEIYIRFTETDGLVSNESALEAIEEVESALDENVFSEQENEPDIEVDPEELAENHAIASGMVYALTYDLDNDEQDYEELKEFIADSKTRIVGQSPWADALRSYCEFLINNLVEEQFDLSSVEYSLNPIRCMAACGFNEKGDNVILIDKTAIGMQSSISEGAGYLVFDFYGDIIGIYNTEMQEYTCKIDEYGSMGINFSEGSFWLEKNGYFGYADPDGIKRINLYYDEPFWFVLNSRAVVCTNENYGVIDLNGNIIVPCAYTSVRILSEKLVAVAEYDRAFQSYNDYPPYALVRPDGEIATEEIYRDFLFKDSILYAQLNDTPSRYHLFSLEGDNLLDTTSPYPILQGAEYVMPNGSDMLSVHYETEKFGLGNYSHTYIRFCDAEMNPINDSIYSASSGFNGLGLAIVMEAELVYVESLSPHWEVADYGNIMINTNGEKVADIPDVWRSSGDPYFANCNNYYVYCLENYYMDFNRYVGNISTEELQMWKEISFVDGTELIIVRDLESELYGLYDGPDMVLQPVYNNLYYDNNDGLIHLNRGAEWEIYQPIDWTILTPKTAAQAEYPTAEVEVSIPVDAAETTITETALQETSVEPQEDEEMAVAEPVDDEFWYGSWISETVLIDGVEQDIQVNNLDMQLDLNPDGSGRISYDEYTHQDYIWSVEDGCAVIGNLRLMPVDNDTLQHSYGSIEMLFRRNKAAENQSNEVISSSSAVAFETEEQQENEATAISILAVSSEEVVGTWHAETVVMGDSVVPAEDRFFDIYLSLNEDGSCSVLEGGKKEESEWTMQNGGITAAGRSLVFMEDGCLCEETGSMQLIYVPCEALPETMDILTQMEQAAEYGKRFSGGGHHTVLLKSDGTVVAVGENDEGQCNVEAWSDIVAVSAGWNHTIGLKSDGTVVAVGGNYNGQCNVEAWSDIVAVSAGASYTMGLKSDGTVVAVGDFEYDIKGWSDIEAISTAAMHIVGLKLDGTVVAIECSGGWKQGECNVEDWKDIVSVIASDIHTVGLKSDGTVVAVGLNHEGQCNVESWRDIIAVSAGESYTIGLKSDGTVVAVGRNYEGQCNVESWRDIVAVSAGQLHSVALKSDGTVVAVGLNNEGQCNVEGWRLD